MRQFGYIIVEQNNAMTGLELIMRVSREVCDHSGPSALRLDGRGLFRCRERRR